MRKKKGFRVVVIGSDGASVHNLDERVNRALLNVLIDMSKKYISDSKYIDYDKFLGIGFINTANLKNGSMGVSLVTELSFITLLLIGKKWHLSLSPSLGAKLKKVLRSHLEEELMVT